MDWSPANTVPGSEPRLHHPPCCRAPAPCLQRALPGSLQSHPTEPPMSSPALCPCHQLLPSAGCHRAGPQCHLGPPERRAIVPPLVSPSLLTCCSPKAGCWGQQGGELCCLREKKPLLEAWAGSSPAQHHGRSPTGMGWARLWHGAGRKGWHVGLYGTKPRGFKESKGDFLEGRRGPDHFLGKGSTASDERREPEGMAHADGDGTQS